MPGVFRARRLAGLSLTEMPVVVTGIGLIASVAMVSTGNVKKRVAEQKLAQDVATINRAIRLYEANGGDMDSMQAHPWWI